MESKIKPYCAHEILKKQYIKNENKSNLNNEVERKR